MGKLDKLTSWVTVFALCIGLWLFAAIAAAEDEPVAAMDPVAGEVLISEEPSAAPHSTGLGSRERVGGVAGPTSEKSLKPKEVKHDLFEGVGEEVDTRIWSISYWMEMAELGLVPFSPDLPIEPAVYTSSMIPATDMFAAVDSPDVPVTTATDTTQTENSIFVNPNDANKLLNSNNSTDWNGSFVTTLYGADAFMSADGGATWGGQVQGAGGPNRGDPAAAIDLSGRYYVGYIAANSGQGVAHSTNEGATWTHVQVAPNPGILADKNHLMVDNSATSAYSGNLYSAWTEFGGINNNEIGTVRSTDGGLTWSAVQEISSAVGAGSHNQGVNIQTGPNGEVYAVWAIYDSWPSDETALGFARSLNGGATWSTATRIITNIRGIRITTTSKNQRVNSFPVMAVDISTGPHSGNIYVVWTNVGVPGINTGPDIDNYMIRSTDGGNTWSSPVKVNQDAPGLGNEHYFPWITCDPATGDLHVIFYDDRNVSSTQCEVFVATSTDAGTTWTDFKVSDVAFTPSPIPGLATGYFGDYNGIMARAGHVYPIWTDNRGGQPMTYVSPFVLEAPLACNGKGYDLATPNFWGTLDGEGGGRAIGFQADEDFNLNAVGIMGDLVEQSFDVVIYDSPDGHSAGSVLATFSATSGGTGFGWNAIPVAFTFTAGNFYVVNWRPSGGGGNWASLLDYYHDSGLPHTVGPLTILEGLEGFNAQNPGNVLHPHLSFCIGGDCTVAILGSPGDPAWNDDVKRKLLGTGFFAQVDSINIADKTPTLAELQSYAAVLVYSDFPGFQDSTALGDNLADYVDSGGGVVVAVFANASIPFGGRFDTDNYWAIAPSSQISGTEEFLGTIHDPSHPILDRVATFSGGTSSYRPSTFDIAPGATRIADWTDGRPLIATKEIGGTRRADLGFFPPSSDARSDFWRAGTDGALLMANALNWVKRPTCEDCDRENFSDPLGDWQTRWFYLNTNAENYYTASGSNCDPDYRGNQPEGLWISDDRGCGNMVVQSPVRIDFLNNYGDNATSFSLDHFTCAEEVTLNIYDKDGALVVSDPLTPDCFNWSYFSTPLTNGISAFEYAYTGGQVEGNTSIDNVELCFTPSLPTVTITATDPTAKEPDNRGKFKLTRTGDTSSDLVVRISRRGTATHKVDYKRIRAKQKIRAGKSSKTIKVIPIDDLIPERRETVIIKIKPDPAYIVGSPAKAKVVIKDND